MNERDEDLQSLRVELLSSLLKFTRVFYKLRTGRDFIVSQPVSRRSHHLEICEALEKVFKREIQFLVITLPPRYGKTEFVINFIAWSMAHYPDSNFIYTSYSKSLAKKQTQAIREIISMPLYKELFGFSVNADSSAKDDFESTGGGSVYASGCDGAITGRGAGIFGVDRFGGCGVIDDSIKPSEATSEVIRESTNDWYFNTFLSRLNDPTKTPIICIGQRTHEEDLPSRFIQKFDGNDWHVINLPALDAAGNALDPAKHTKEQLLTMKETQPYVFAAQYQQDPIPAGGGLFKREWFVVLDKEPEMIATFVVGDTAETNKTYNDPTVFSFFGIYEVEQMGRKTGTYALHWLDCVEAWVEPADLKDLFMNFWMDCLNHPVKPLQVAIEKKSTGTYFISQLAQVQGLNVIDIPRNAYDNGNHNSKANRYIEIQPYIARGLVSLPAYGKHTKACLDHMVKITANNSHRHDDRADTCADGIQLGLIKKVIFGQKSKNDQTKVMDAVLEDFRQKLNASRAIYGS